MLSRRLFLQSSGILLSCVVGGRTLLLTPAEAHASGIKPQVLSEDEVNVLEAVVEAIVPGARKAGVAQYIDKQLASSVEESLLMLKYLGVAPPFTDFYRSGLQAMAHTASQAYDKSWNALSAKEATELLNKIASDEIQDWQGPPASFFFFVLRTDGSDVVYGTEQGFADIGMPYMAHIVPEQRW